MNGFIAKPFDVDAAIALITKVTGRIASTLPESDPAPGGTTEPSTESYQGLDIATGMARLRNRSVYQKLLARFAKENSDVVSRIRSNDSQEGAQLAHKLKGAAGNLAIEEVALLAGKLEQELGSGSDAANTLDELQSAVEIGRAHV